MKRLRAMQHRLTQRVVGVLLVALLGSSGFIGARGVTAAGSPPRGGTLTDNLGVVLDCMDAARSGELSVLYVATAMSDMLITQDSKGRFVSDLATKWRFSNGGKQLTFSLRPGMRFSNGHALDAKAVRFNLLRKENASVLGPLKSVKLDSSDQLTMNFSTPFRPVLSNLAFLLPVYDPSSITAKDCTSVVGSGPFKVASVGPGFSSITMVRNPYHTWNVGFGVNKGTAYLSKLVFKTVVDPATTVSELLTSGLDMSAVAATQLGRLNGNSKFKIYRKLQQNINWLGFNTAHKPFNSAAVRKAIAEAVDRNAIVTAWLNGLGKPAYSMVPATVPFSDPTARSYAPPYNPSQAKSVLAANHATGPYTLLGFSGFYAPISEVIQAELAAVGVTVNVVNKPLADYFPAASSGAFDLNVESYFGTDPDILFTLFHSSQETSAGSNYTFYKNPTLDKYIVEGRESIKKAAAAKAYDAAQRLIDTQVVADPLVTPEGLTAVSTRVGGYHRNVWSLFPVWQDLYAK